MTHRASQADAGLSLGGKQECTTFDDPLCSSCPDVFEPMLVFLLTGFLDGIRDVLSLVVLSQNFLHTFQRGPKHTIGTLVVVPRAHLLSENSVMVESCGLSRSLRATAFRQTAFLLGPKLCGVGRNLRTLIQLEVQCHQALGSFRFGLVPHTPFLRDGSASRSAAYTFDGLGRVWLPGGRWGLKTLYGKRVTAGDVIGMRLDPVRDGEVHGSFLINGKDFGRAFSLRPADAYSPVLYFDALQRPDDITMKSFVGSWKCRSEPQIQQLEGIIVKEFGPGCGSWELVSVSQHEFSQGFSVEDLCHRLAIQLSETGPSVIHTQQIDLLIDGQASNKAAKLCDVITYQNGVHLEDIHWHLEHLIG